MSWRNGFMVAGVLALTTSVSSTPPSSSPGEQCPLRSMAGNLAALEEVLATAEIESVKEIGMGVTNPRKVELKHGDKKFFAAFKPIKRGRHGGFWESYEAEVAAYELDKLLGLGMTPPTVVRRVGGNKGSLQYWVEDCKLYRDVEDKTPKTPEWSQQLSRMKMMDVLINNADRNAQNFLVDPDFHIVLIDHSRAFISGKQLLKDPKKLPNQFDRLLVEQLRALDRETLDGSLEELLMGGQIKGILERRDALLEHLDKLLAERGEARVLF